jgi:hypothetical protein
MAILGNVLLLSIVNGQMQNLTASTMSMKTDLLKQS